MKAILSYILVLNIITYIAFAIDKKRAKAQRWRIPELRLLTLAFLGGGIGAWRGMVDYRHKTNKAKFRVLVPVFICLQFGFFVYFFDTVFIKNSPSWLLLFLAFFIHLILFYLLKWFAQRGHSHK